MKKLSKEALFEDYAMTAFHVFSNMEVLFNVANLSENLTGVALDADMGKPDTVEAMKSYIRDSRAWSKMSAVYDYAYDGIVDEHHEVLVVESDEILSHLNTPCYSLSRTWGDIVQMADARFALDDGADEEVERLALLANVDIRTVRNAVSAGDLVAQKQGPVTYITNASARSWLSGRRGYKPTRLPVEWVEDITDVSLPTEFGSYLVSQRKKLGMDANDKKLVVFHPLVDAKAIDEIEMGVFRLPLDTVTPLADFYQIDRNDFLVTVMKVFFGDQYRALVDLSSTEHPESTDDQ